jgi:hypothetical protein
MFDTIGGAGAVGAGGGTGAASRYGSGSGSDQTMRLRLRNTGFSLVVFSMVCRALKVKKGPHVLYVVGNVRPFLKISPEI